jgi:hypothetical protein
VFVWKYGPAKPMFYPQFLIEIAILRCRSSKKTHPDLAFGGPCCAWSVRI